MKPSEQTLRKILDQAFYQFEQEFNHAPNVMHASENTMRLILDVCADTSIQVNDQSEYVQMRGKSYNGIPVRVDHELNDTVIKLSGTQIVGTAWSGPPSKEKVFAQEYLINEQTYKIFGRK